MSTDTRLDELEARVEQQHETIAGILELLHTLNHAIPRGDDVNLLSDED